ncbi:unnamed protein product [Agarophyton chilense]
MLPDGFSFDDNGSTSRFAHDTANHGALAVTQQYNVPAHIALARLDASSSKPLNHWTADVFVAFPQRNALLKASIRVHRPLSARSPLCFNLLSISYCDCLQMGSTRAYLLLILVLGCSFRSPVLAVPSLPSIARIATYDDISTTFNLVYAVTDSCPSSVTFGVYTNDERQFPILPPSNIEEDGSQCSGEGSLNFVTERTVNEPELLEALRLESFREALSKNGNAEALVNSKITNDLLVGWHSGTRTCGSLSYPTETIYFVIREDQDYKITFRRSDSSNRVNIPPNLRSLLIVAPRNQVCLLVDKSTNPDQDVTLLTEYSNGTVANSQLTTAGAIALEPPNEAFTDEDNSSSSATNEDDTDDLSTTTEEIADAPPSQSISPEPSPSASSSAPPSTAPAPSVAPILPVAPPTSDSGTLESSPSPLATVAISPSDFGTLIASPNAFATVAPSPSALSSIFPAASALPPGAAGGIAFEDDLESSSEENDGSACFPASAVVRTERGDVPMHQVQIGDRVQTAIGFSDVLLFTHRLRGGQFGFTKLKVKSGRELIVSDGHYLFRNNGDLMAASSVVAGDVLRMADDSEDGSVVETVRIFDVGLYNPQTESGSIVVNGFVTSTYTTAVDPKMAHTALLMPVRMMYKVWRWPVEQLSLALEEGSRIGRWMPRGEAEVVGL